ncbi:MAG TPA: cache domain-containing protein [Candidatus Babeliales bacterium]|nr:cache domain-containing protein [Candidatus Babeliales bacterium]
MTKKIVNGTSLVVCIITCGAFLFYNYLYYSIIPSYQKKLLTMVNNRADEITAYLNEQENNALHLSQDAIVIDALSNTFISESQSLNAAILSHKEHMGFKDILLVNKDKTIIFSVAKKNLIGIKINQNNHDNSALEESYERATMTLTNDFSDFSFNELLQESALFITIPILKEKKFIGALIYQLNQEKIYLITNQYIGLGKTGEAAIAKKEGAYAIFLSPTRNDPDLAFKKRILFTDPPLTIQASILGQEGSGTALDYRDKKVIGAWKFVPKLDWGILVKIDLDEVAEPINIAYKILTYCLIIFLLSLLFNLYFFYPTIRKKLKTINDSSPYNKIPSFIKNPLFIIMIIAFGFTIKNIIQCIQQQSYTIEKAKNQAIKIVSKNADIIETILTKISSTAQFIADDLKTGYLTKDTITKRIERDLAENNIILDITVLFSPYHYDTNTELYLESTSLNTIKDKNVFTNTWYTQAIAKGTTWIINQNHSGQQSHSTATYACSFFNKKNEPQGVIAITYSLDSLLNIAEYSNIGNTGYSVLMDDNGSFIFHPTQSLVQTKTTLLQYAQKKGNEELAIIAQKVINGNPLMASYLSELTRERCWIYTQPIKINNWIIGSLFSEDEIGLSTEKIRHYYFWILIWVTLASLLLSVCLWQNNKISLIYYLFTVNALLILALITTWYIIKKTSTIRRETRTIITDQSNLNKFLNNLEDEANRKHEPAPINIPCGILLYSLSITDTDHITVSGYIWNKYNKKFAKNISHGMELPQATRMSFGKPISSQSDNQAETITWNIQGLLFQDHNYTRYPFDQQHIRIILEHRDIEKTIILTPDLVAYKKISPESLPGLDKEFSLAGFTVEQTFFEYHQIDPTANFGFKNYGKTTDNYQLVYNAIMNRNLLNPFIIYLLPLLVILFSLFSTLLLTKKTTEPLAIFGGYTGLFFALIVLQRSLREQHPTGETLYMEYAFFYTYISIILLIMHTILMYYYKQWKPYQNISIYYMKILFWPFQCISWLITTLIIFY